MRDAPVAEPNEKREGRCGTMNTKAEMFPSPWLWVHHEISGVSHGRGSPALVVLPAIGCSKECLGLFGAELARSRRVLLCKPAVGGASRSARGLPSTRRLASDVLGVLERRGIKTFDLIGVSLGGMVAQWMAIDAPSQVRQLILASTAGRGLRRAEISADEAQAEARCLVFTGDQTSSRAETPGAEVFASPTERQMSDRNARHRSDLAWLSAAASKHDAIDPLRTLQCPTLILSGSGDRLIPIEVQHELQNAIPHATHAFVENAGHDVLSERPIETAGLILGFDAMVSEREAG